MPDMSTRRALEGIRVIDWTQMISGPVATNVLAALGAEVIHVEQAGVGDSARGLVRWGGLDYKLPGGRTVLLEVFNRNKKSLALNLQTQGGREIIYRLAEKSDVFVTNFSRSRVDEFKLNYETLKKCNPLLIYASASLYGRKGVDSDMPGYDFLGQARSGMTWVSGEKGDIPVPGAPNISDQITGVALGYGIVVALLARERLGIAQEVHASQLGAMISIIEESALGNVLFCGRDQDRFVRADRRNPISNCFKCKDGRWVFITMLYDKHLTLLSKMLNIEGLSQDPRFSSIRAREENRHVLISILDKAFSTKTADEWMEIARKHRAPLTIANRLEDLEKDPQVLANDYIIEYDHPVLGTTRYAGYPFQLSETPASCESPAPEVGQHTEEILIDICGYSWADIQGLQNEGVI